MKNTRNFSISLLLVIGCTIVCQVGFAQVSERLQNLVGNRCNNIQQMTATQCAETRMNALAADCITQPEYSWGINKDYAILCAGTLPIFVCPCFLNVNKRLKSLVGLRCGELQEWTPLQCAETRHTSLSGGCINQAEYNWGVNKDYAIFCVGVLPLFVCPCFSQVRERLKNLVGRQCDKVPPLTSLQRAGTRNTALSDKCISRVEYDWAIIKDYAIACAGDYPVLVCPG